MASSQNENGENRRGNYILCHVRYQTVLKFSILLCWWKSNVISYISKLSNPVVMKSIRIWYIYFNSFDIVSAFIVENETLLLGGVMGCCSLLRAGEQVCAANIVIHFQPEAKSMVKY